VGEQELLIRSDDREISLPLDDIAGAKMVFEFETTDKPGSRRGKKRRKR
jgi:hypothetical protein